mgnify:CR=1 FL=1
MNKTRQPLLHISRRGAISFGSALAIRLAAILLALLLCAAVTMITTGENPVAIFRSIIRGSFGTNRKMWLFFQNTAILLCISLAVTPAFKMRCWNLGAEGQVLMGALATGACMLQLAGKIPDRLLIPVMFLSGILAGAVWAAVPALFKAKWNTNETLFTLMMNYVATQLVAYFCVLWENPRGSAQIGIINQRSKIGWFPEIYNKQLLVILIITALTILMFVYLRYSKHGFEIAVVGESERTAQYVGIKVGRVIIRTMLLSGAVCGLAGALLVGSVNHTFSTTLVNGRGFTAVMVSWLAKFNPIVMVLTSALLVLMDTGASDISTSFGLNQSFGSILTGIIIFFIIGSEFFINYKLHLNKAGKEHA